jgi:hypothetical protein
VHGCSQQQPSAPPFDLDELLSGQVAASAQQPSSPLRPPPYSPTARVSSGSAHRSASHGRSRSASLSSSQAASASASHGGESKNGGASGDQQQPPLQQRSRRFSVADLTGDDSDEDVPSSAEPAAAAAEFVPGFGFLSSSAASLSAAELEHQQRLLRARLAAVEPSAPPS